MEIITSVTNFLTVHKVLVKYILLHKISNCEPIYKIFVTFQTILNAKGRLDHIFFGAIQKS